MPGDEREEAVRAALQRWLDATMSNDADTLDQLLEDGYTFTHATTAQIDTRKEWLDSFREGRRNYRTWQVSDIVLRLYPSTAVMTGRGYQEIVRPEGNVATLETSFLNTWIERDGRWRLAAWAATQLPD